MLELLTFVEQWKGKIIQLITLQNQTKNFWMLWSINCNLKCTFFVYLSQPILYLLSQHLYRFSTSTLSFLSPLSSKNRLLSFLEPLNHLALVNSANSKLHLHEKLEKNGLQQRIRRNTSRARHPRVNPSLSFSFLTIF